MNKKLITLILGGLSALPAFAFAVAFPSPPTATTINLNILTVNILNFVWPVVVIAIVFFFIYIGFLFLTAQGEEGKVVTARKALLWGIVGVVVILLAFSIVGMIMFALGLIDSGANSGGGGDWNDVSGACRSAQGPCQIATQTDCENTFGEFDGAGSTCPIATGACCWGATCGVRTQSACYGNPNTMINKIYYGDNTTCQGITCPGN